jgi:hypothetical protein
MEDYDGTGNGGGTGGGNGAPSEKRLSFAKTLMTERPGTKPPAGWETDWKICSAFIDEMLKIKVPRAGGGGDMTPTPKKLEFAKTLMAERPGTVAPENWDKDWRICSSFIDEMLKIKVARKA